MADIASLSMNQTVEALVQQYRTSQRKVLTPLEDRRTRLTARLNALAELRTKLRTLNETLRSLLVSAENNPFEAKSVSSSKTSVAVATATSVAQSGSHTLHVSRLARADKVLSSLMSASSTSIVDAEGPGEKQFSVIVNGTETFVSVNVSAGQTNESILTDVAAAVNASGASVTASVINVTGSDIRLVFTSNSSGSDAAIALADTSGNLLGSVGLTAAVIAGREATSGDAAGYIVSDVNELNAVFTFDGIAMSRQTNSIGDALSGVTIELKGLQASTDDPVILSVGVDRAKIRATVEKFIKDYNDVIVYLNSRTSVDPGAKVRQILAGDAAFLGLRVDLRSIVGSAVTTVDPDQPRLLAEVGIALAADGTLSIKDGAVLDTALASAGKGIADLFTSAEGIAVRLQSSLGPFVSLGGVVDTARNGTDTQMAALKTRITRTEATIARRIEKFRAEMVKLQVAVAKATQQQQSINAMVSGTLFI